MKCPNAGSQCQKPSNPEGLCFENEIGTWTKPSWNFEQCQQQTSLNFHDKAISNIAEKFFINNLDLQTLNLDENQIIMVPEKLFSYNINLEYRV